MKRFVTVLLLAGMLVFPLVAIDIKVAHVVNEQDAFHIAAVKFKELTEKYTNGQVKITIYQCGVGR